MNSSAKRLMAVMTVMFMVASSAVMFVSDGQDSSATGVDCSTFFYNQLETDLAKHTYEQAVAADSFDGFVVDLTEDDKTTKATYEGDYYMEQISMGLIAAGKDDPRTNYYFKGWGYATDNPNDVTVTIANFDTETFSGEVGSTKADFDTEIDELIASAPVGISPGMADYQKAMAIHDYVADTLAYNTAHMDSSDPKTSGAIRSLYATLKETYTDPYGGHYMVVCEGYAKLFKALCDHYDVDCLIMSGDADNGDEIAAHMWNYVCLDEQWYLVDCTWDDQQHHGGGIIDDYLLVGYDKNIGGKLVLNSHMPKGVTVTTAEGSFDVEFVNPPLSAVSIDLGTGEPTGTQYLVTFKVDSEIYTTEYVQEGETIVLPANPVVAHKNFVRWTNDDGSEYNYSDPVLDDLILKAEFTSNPVWTLSYDTKEGTPIADAIVDVSAPVVTITSAKPLKEGFVFKGWNTSADGKGVSFAPGDELHLNSNYTLYAVWEDSTSIAYKVDSVVDQAAVFLSKETVPGVNNLLLSIGVVTAVISLLAILAISRK